MRLDSARYRIRLLICLAFTILCMIGAAHLPFNVGFPAVGWYLENAGETIRVDLADVRTAAAGRSIVPSDGESDGDAPEEIETRRAAAAGAAKSNSGSAPPLEKMQGRRVLDSAHRMPEIVGGIGAYYIQIEYPEEALMAGVQGRLILSFVVEPDGRTTGVEVLRALHPACDSAAVRALRRTRFVPGRQNGEAIPVRMRLPVRFKIVDRSDGLAAAPEP